MLAKEEPQNHSVPQILVRLGKVATRKELVSKGVTAWSLKQAVKSGAITQICRGYFALPGADPLDVYLAQFHARPGCFTRAAQVGLWVIKAPQPAHVTAAHGNPIPGYVVHRASGRQTFLEILRQCVKCGSEVEALTVLESAVVLRRCTIADLRREFCRREDAGARAIIAMIDVQSMSIVETVARYYLRAAGLNVQSQFFIKNVGHVDLLVEGVLCVETDGERYHNTSDGWVEDRRRDNALVIGGYRLLRIPAKMVLSNPEMMVTQVRQALARKASR